MSKKKARQRDTSSAASAKGSAAANRTGRRGPFPIVIAAVAILLVVAALWAVKGLAEPSGEAGTAEEVSPAAASSTAPTSSSSSDIWSLAARSVDMDAIAEANVPAIVDFGSDSCIPCKQMAPVLKKSNEEMRGRAIVKFVDVWKYTDAADGFPVQVIPTQVLMMPGGDPYEPSEELAAKYGLWFSQYTDNSGNLVFTTHQGALNQEQMDAILADMGV